MGKQIILCLFFMLLATFLCSANDSTAKRNLNGYVFENNLGEKVSLGDLDSDFVFLEMWSMSCGPCLREMEYFKELPARYADKSIAFVSICVENNVPLWKKFLKQRKIDGNQWITPILGSFQKENGFYAVPRFVLVDRQGNIVWNNAKRPSDPALKIDLDHLWTTPSNE